MSGEDKLNDLPGSWVKVKSKSRPDKSYYYNKKLKVSVWQLKEVFQLENGSQAASQTKSVPETPNKPPKNQLPKATTDPIAFKTIKKKNAGKDRMKGLRCKLNEDVERGTKRLASNILDDLSSVVKPREQQTKDKKNGAAERMKNMRERLQKDDSDNKTQPITKQEKESQKASETKEAVVEQASIAQPPDDEVEQMDVSFEDSEEKFASEYEMDWEDIPEQEVIDEVHKIRTSEVKTQETASISTSSNAIQPTGFYIVVDTNVLLSNIFFVEEIKGKVFKDIGKAIIFLPYIVLRELDHLKTDGSIARQARRAINFIDKCFQSRDPFLIGQSARESLQKKLLPIECGDDEILNCCLHVQEITKKLILLTNDKNLRNKAFVNKIESFSRDMLNFTEYNIKNGIKFE